MAEPSSVRWRSEALKQKQLASTLLMGLNGGALAFTVTPLHEQQAFLGYWQTMLFHIHAILQIASMSCGVGFALNRARDFEVTARIAQTREKMPGHQSLRTMRQTVRRWGRITRALYVTQLVTFIFAMIAFVAFFLALYKNILYR